MGSGYTLLLSDVTYRWLGDMPDLELAGSLFYSVGVSRTVLSSRGSVLASLSGGTSIMDTVDPPLSAGLSFLYSIRAGKSVSLGAYVGLSEGSPDFSAYLGWSLAL